MRITPFFNCTTICGLSFISPSNIESSVPHSHVNKVSCHHGRVCPLSTADWSLLPNIHLYYRPGGPLPAGSNPPGVTAPHHNIHACSRSAVPSDLDKYGPSADFSVGRVKSVAFCCVQMYIHTPDFVLPFSLSHVVSPQRSPSILLTAYLGISLS